MSTSRNAAELHVHTSGGWTVDGDPKERFVYHAAGLAGAGGSSYIDSVILRDRDANTAWGDQADGTLEERVYLCQNWRADVVALMTSDGQLINQIRYDGSTPAAARRGGVPFGIAKPSRRLALDGGGDVDGDDYTRFSTLHSGGTHPYADWNWDGTVDASDAADFLSDKNADTGLGRGDPGYDWGETGGALRKAYAGYEIDPVLTGSEGWESLYHVRHRVYLSGLGRWTRRNPTGYREGELHNLYSYVGAVPLILVDPTGLPPGYADSECTGACTKITAKLKDHRLDGLLFDGDNCPPEWVVRLFFGWIMNNLVLPTFPRYGDHGCDENIPACRCRPSSLIECKDIEILLWGTYPLDSPFSGCEVTIYGAALIKECQYEGHCMTGPGSGGPPFP